MKKSIFSSLIAIVAVSAVCLSGANAHTFETVECKAFARDITFFATLRDNSMKESDVIDQLMPIMTSYKGNPASYIRDDEDIGTMLAVIHLVYEHPAIDPDTIGNLTFQSCTGTVSNAPIKTTKPQIAV